MKIVREPARVIASVFSLCGFVVAVLAGLRAGASTTHVLTSAILAMLACKAVGLWAGRAGERAILEFVDSYQKANPVPDLREAERAMLSPEHPRQNVDSRLMKPAA
jgi:membrane protein DedA with SNARE-associated domain